jgi:lipopolysaccharide/colanic/teichoic acid biosynthesis glycosyltransferase
MREDHGLAPSWRGRLKRAFDVGMSIAALLLLAPLFAVVGLGVLLAMGRPVLFKQERIGLEGRPFRLFKFRTMKNAGPGGLLITGTGDSRVTRLGRFLRGTKLDELPQLVNVLMGDMSIVGPRPEVARYVALYSPAQRLVLSVRPGLTDPATVLFRDEESLLGAVPEPRREDYYVREIMPRKLAINLDYLAQAGFWYDLRLIGRTMIALVDRRRS